MNDDLNYWQGSKPEIWDLWLSSGGYNADMSSVESAAPVVKRFLNAGTVLSTYACDWERSDKWMF